MTAPGDFHPPVPFRDDSIQLYLNGTRIWLNNLMDNATPADLATASISGADELIWHWVPLALRALQPGNNVFAAEIRQSSATSSDVSFDLELSIRWPTPGGFINTTPATTPIARIVPTSGSAFNLVLSETTGRIYTV